MKISLKNKDSKGFMRTINGYINLKTEYIDEEFVLDKKPNMAGSVSYEGSEFQIHTGFDQLVLSFGKGPHIFVTTTNNGDAVGSDGWRHAAYKIGLELTGKEVVNDASEFIVELDHLDNVSQTILDHIHKLVDIEQNNAKEVISNKEQQLRSLPSRRTA